MSDAIDQFAQQITLAEAAVGQAEAVHADAQAQHAKVAGHLATLGAERHAIVARRAGGDHRPDDGATLELIRADVEGLAALQATADGALAATSTTYREAVAALKDAKAAFSAEESRIVVATLDKHANHLLVALAETLRQRAVAAASQPMAGQNFGAVIARLVSLDAIMTPELTGLRRAQPFRELPYIQHPVFMPSEQLFEQIWRLHGTDGRFV